MIFALVLAILWVGTGAALVWWNGRTRGRQVRRGLSSAVAALGDEVTLTLSHRVPTEIGVLPDHDVVLLLDHSGSMGAAPGSPLREMLNAARDFVRVLPDNVAVAVVAFDHQAVELCPLGAGHAKAMRAMTAIGPGGGTDFASAIDCADAVLDQATRSCSRTVILLSDGQDSAPRALEAAERLRRRADKPEIVCAGFGEGADRIVLAAIAGSSDRVHVVENQGRLDDLFAFLAGEIGAARPVGAVAKELVWAPRPFAVSGAAPSPQAETDGNGLRLSWVFPVLRSVTPELSYSVRTTCVGWRRVAAPGGSMTWRMPDGTERSVNAPHPPRVLVLPRWLIWAWWLFNPLFMLLIQPLLACAPKPAAKPLPKPRPPETPPLPMPPAEAAAEPYHRQVRSAVIVGVGKSGEEMAITLDQLFQVAVGNRAAVTFLSVRLGESVDGHQSEPGPATSFNRIAIGVDLAQTVMDVRDHGASPARAWVPAAEWLASARPLSAIWGALGDRAFARLALLTAPEPLEKQLQARLADDPKCIVVLLGSVEDAESSGMLAEVAHVAAGLNHGVTAILAAPSMVVDARQGAVALGRELARMLALRGDDVVSDRGGHESRATKLFDHIVVAGDPGTSEAARRDEAVDIAWGWLTWPEMDEVLPTSTSDTVLTGRAEAEVLPMAGLWRWARAGLLARGCARWQKVSFDGDVPTVPSDSAEAVATARRSFWTPIDRAPSQLIHDLARVVMDGEPATLLVALGAQAGGLYVQQRDFCLRERAALSAHVVAWLEDELERSRAEGQMGLDAIAKVLTGVHDDILRVERILDHLGGDGGAREASQIGQALSQELAIIATACERAVTAWSLTWFGRPGGRLGSDDRPPLALAVAREEETARHLLASLSPAAWSAAEARREAWITERLGEVGSYLRFQVRTRDGIPMPVMLLTDREFMAGDLTLDHLLTLVEPYGTEILGWPDASWFPHQTMRTAAMVGWGRHAPAAFSSLGKVLGDDDPYQAAAFQFTSVPVSQAFLDDHHTIGAVPHVWSEEEFGQRLAARVRSRMHRDPGRWPLQMIGLFRDPGQLINFFASVARGEVVRRGDEVVLMLAGMKRRLALRQEGLDGFDLLVSAARQAVNVGRCLDGDRLVVPAATANDPESFIQEVERAWPTVVDHAEWGTWRLCIMALASGEGTP